MFAKIVKGKDLLTLEKEKTDWLRNNSTNPNREQRSTLKVYHVQQFVVGEADPKTVQLVNSQPAVSYWFCLLLICGYE